MTSDSVLAVGEGLVPPTTSVRTGESPGAAGAVDAVVDGAAGVAGASGTGEAVVVVAPVGAGAGEAVAVAVGAGSGSAHAGELVTAGREAKERTSAARSAVVFRIEFTFCLS